MKKRFFIVLAIVAVLLVGFYLRERSEPEMTDEAAIPAHACFERSVAATPEAPYSVEEYIELVIDTAVVSGKKSGFQSGPDMTNGYEGSLSGTKDSNRLSLRFDYVIEGSAQTEQEEYLLFDESLTKLRYPLKEESGILVPDKTKPFTEQVYSQTACLDA